MPEGSSAYLSGADTETPCIMPDLAGDYVVRLVVNDGWLYSEAKTVNITVEDEGETAACDLDGDGDVDPDDTAVFISAYRTCKGDAGYLENCDLDGDGCITALDYREFYVCYQESKQ
jgi:hypothetical protein